MLGFGKNTVSAVFKLRLRSENMIIPVAVVVILCVVVDCGVALVIVDEEVVAGVVVWGDIVVDGTQWTFIL